MSFKEAKEKKGITLIALVITIVILIILSTITINFAFGENGLVTMAETAKAESEKDAIIEQIQLDIADKEIGNQGSINEDEFYEILGKYGTVSADETILTTTKGNYDILISDIFSGNIQLSEFELPESMSNDFFNQININYNGETYTTDFDVSNLKNSSKATYYLSPDGNDSNTGLSREEPLKTFETALNLCDSGDTIYLLEGMYTRKNWASSTYPDITKSVNIIGENDKVYIKQGDDYNFTQNEEFNNVYQTARNNVNQVLDISDLSSGNISELTEVTSISECNETSSSYYCDGVNTYIHMKNEQTPNNENIIINLKTGSATFDIRSTEEDIKVYIENITTLGGHRGNIAAYGNEQYTPTVLAKNCKFLYSKTEQSEAFSAVSMRSAYSIFQNCEASYCNNDGFNYHNGVTGKICNAIEINCIGSNNGIGWETPTCNGTSIHDGGKILRINGEYYNNYGGNVADVNEGTVSVNLNCYAHDSIASTNNGYDTDFTAQQAGTEMYLYSCRAEGSAYNIYGADGTAIYVRNCVYETTFGDNIIVIE